MVANSIKVVAIIPARGGSKSIPRKNVRKLASVPLLAYSIAAGLQATTVSRVIVSTDDEKIALLARQWGAEVPFLRPTELAQDDTLDLPVFKHALTWLQEHEDFIPDIVIQLRPTSPLRPPNLVDQAVQILLGNKDVDSVRGVVPSRQNPYKMWQIPNEGVMMPLLQSDFDEPFNMPRQALPKTYWQTGHIDAIRTNVIMQQQSMSGKRIFPLLIDPEYEIDIDTPRDWKQAEWLLSDLRVPFVQPLDKHNPYDLLRDVKMLVLDFDGVLTDNRVWVNQNGIESVATSRSDGMGLSLVKKKGLDVFVLSKERNPVVQARCTKLGISYQQSTDDKATTLLKILQEKGLSLAQTAYVGNDINDLDCMRLVGCSVAVADADKSVLVEADLVLSKPGGHGAVRELCDILLEVQFPRRA